jgi:hypothetical protein
MVALMIWIGVQPSVFLRRMEPSVRHVLEQVDGGALQAQAEQEEEIQITVSSTTSLEDPGEAEGLLPTHPGDEE